MMEIERNFIPLFNAFSAGIAFVGFMRSLDARRYGWAWLFLLLGALNMFVVVRAWTI